MKKQILFLLAVFACCNVLQAQLLQVGIGAAANNTFFHKGNSVYEGKYHGRDIAPAGGLFTTVSLRLSDLWSLQSGFGFHIKQYRVRTQNFGITGIEGYFYYDARFHCLEIPLVLAFKTARPRMFKFEYRLGLVNSYYIPVQDGYGFRLEGTIPVTAGVSSPMPGWEKTYSPDIFISVALLKFGNNQRRHGFAISYQYGLLETAKFNYEVKIKTSTVDNVYPVELRPTLSAFMLSYTFYPKWLTFGKSDTNEQLPAEGGY